MSHEWGWRSRWLVTQWVCRHWVGEDETPSVDDPAGMGLPEVLRVWQTLVEAPTYAYRHYAVFVTWLHRSFGDRDGEFYWRHCHKIHGDRMPTVKRLVLWWSGQILQRVLISSCVGNDDDNP